MRRTALKRKASSSGVRKRRKPDDKRVISDRLDRMASQWCRSIGQCELQGWWGVRCTPQLHTHHLSRRTCRANRWYESNLKCLCAAHHDFVHKRPWLETLWVNQFWPGLWEELWERERANNGKSVIDYEELEAEWNAKEPRGE
jgi:hypothetical protein